MAGTGPPPKLNHRHRGASIGLVRLPAEGRQGSAPAWPMDDEPTPEQWRLWNELWRTPQAVAWEGAGWFRVVGRYVLVVIKAEQDMMQHHMAEARQLEDRLGLTPKAMRMMLWTIEEDVDTSASVVSSDRWREAAAS